MLGLKPDQYFFQKRKVALKKKRVEFFLAGDEGGRKGWRG
jgi:hypothetical protein